jgi:sterol desaturase/sphingolipid hydroxylase (fatty acid hydroxylase superfamily)
MNVAATEQGSGVMAAHLIEHFHGILLSLARSAAWLAILVAIFVPAERMFALHPQRILRKEVAVDVAYYFLNGLVIALLLGIPVVVVALALRHLIPGVIIATIAAWPLWLRACVAMVVGEIGYYWGHRLTHEIPLLWRFHAVHHSAEELDFLVSSRGHPVDVVFSRMCMMTPLVALGLVNMVHSSDGLIPLMVMMFGMIWGFFIHANVRWRLGPLEWLVATPGFHHWHHTLGGKRRDCNYSTMFPWLDRLFGTHYLPNEWPERYGIDEPMPHSLIGQFVRPFEPVRAAPSSISARRAPAPVAPAPSGPAAGAPTAAPQVLGRGRWVPRSRATMDRAD